MDLRVGINIEDWCIFVKRFEVVKFWVKIVFGLIILFKNFVFFVKYGMIWIRVKFYERKMNDLYKLFSGKCFEEI